MAAVVFAVVAVVAAVAAAAVVAVVAVVAVTVGVDIQRKPRLHNRQQSAPSVVLHRTSLYGATLRYVPLKQ